MTYEEMLTLNEDWLEQQVQQEWFDNDDGVGVHWNLFMGRFRI